MRKYKFKKNLNCWKSTSGRNVIILYLRFFMAFAGNCPTVVFPRCMVLERSSLGPQQRRHSEHQQLKPSPYQYNIYNHLFTTERFDKIKNDLSSTGVKGIFKPCIVCWTKLISNYIMLVLLLLQLTTHVNRDDSLRGFEIKGISSLEVGLFRLLWESTLSILHSYRTYIFQQDLIFWITITLNYNSFNINIWHNYNNDVYHSQNVKIIRTQCDVRELLTHNFLSKVVPFNVA